MHKILKTSFLGLFALATLVLCSCCAFAQQEQPTAKERLKILFQSSNASTEIKSKMISLLNMPQIPEEDVNYVLSHSSSLNAKEITLERHLAEGITMIFVQKNIKDAKRLLDLQSRLPYAGKVWFFAIFQVLKEDETGKEYVPLAQNVLDSPEINKNICDEANQELVFSAFDFIVRSGFNDVSYIDSVIKTKFCDFESNRLYTAVYLTSYFYKERAKDTVAWYFIQKSRYEAEMKMCLDYFDTYKFADANLLRSLKAEQIQQVVGAAVTLGVLNSNNTGLSVNGILPQQVIEPETPVLYEQAPNFRIKGTNRTLNSVRGKNLILTFFPKCFTGGCVNHLTSLNKVYPQIKDANTEVWAVSVDPTDGEQGQLAFAKKLGLQFRLVSDEDRKISLLYGTVESPTDLATRQTIYIGKDGKIAYVDRSVHVDTHGEDVLAQMKELGWLK